MLPGDENKQNCFTALLNNDHSRSDMLYSDFSNICMKTLSRNGSKEWIPGATLAKEWTMLRGDALGAHADLMNAERPLPSLSY